ncbi:hypothetical protein ACFY0G_40490 [Streptomyces sp. NPDC001552]|uniref:hypothetical protein n=1 Tax=Streptomyces sp. NPDC001552 TaxID=3364587 RepID=UPI0036B2320B
MTTHVSLYRLTARELAQLADTEEAAGHYHLAKAAAELGLVYLKFETVDFANAHVGKALEAAEKARENLMYEDAVGVTSDTSRARLHLSLAELDAADLPAPAPAR